MKALWCRLFHRTAFRFVPAARMTLPWCARCETYR